MCPELVERHRNCPSLSKGTDAMCPELVEGRSIATCALSLSKGTDTDQLHLLPALRVWRRPRRRQGQALRVALRRLRASLDPSSGRRNLRQCREQEGEWVWRGLARGWLGRSGAGFDLCFSLFCWENSLVSNTSSNTIEACNSGTPQQRRANRAVGWMRPSTIFDTAVTELDQHHRDRRT